MATFVWIINIGVILVIFVQRKPGFQLFHVREQNSGSMLALALFTMFAPQLFGIGLYHLSLTFKRWKDRGFRLYLNSNLPDDDSVSSRSSLTQASLNTLYTGGPFNLAIT
jgi:hypothetical protein